MWALAFSSVAIAWIYGLSIDLTGDSGLYAAISRQMVESGDWLNLKINGTPYDQKPHLFFWLAGTGITLFGITNFSFKIFLFLAGAAGIYFTWRLARLLFSKQAGRLAALFVGTSQIFFLYFFDIHTDTVLQSAVIMALWQLAEYLKQKKPLNFLLAFTGIGLGMLTKGPVAAVLPFFFVLFYLLLEKDFRRMFHPRWIAGIVLILAVVSPTLFHLWQSFGIAGLRFYFIDNNLGRISGTVAGTSTDPFFYTYNLLWAFLPWTVPVLAGLAAEVKTWFNGRLFNHFSASLLGSVLVLFTIYSIARGKAPNYLMVLIPPLAVVAAGHVQYFEAWHSRVKSRMVYLHYFLLLLMLVIIFAAWFFVAGEKNTGLLIILVVAAFIFLVIFQNKENSHTNRLIYASLIVTATLNLYLNTTVIPYLFTYQGAHQAIAVFESQKTEGDRLYNWDLEEYELFFMAEDSVRNITSWEEMNEVMENSGTWIYTNEGKHNEIADMKFKIDTVYRFYQRGMNSISLEFLNSDIRAGSLKPQFLIKTKDCSN